MPTTSPSGRRPQIGRALGVALVWIFVGANILLLLWMFLQSFRDTRDIMSSPWGLPSGLDPANIADAWVSSGFGKAVGNSLIVTIASSVVIIVLAVPAAYVLSKVESRVSNALRLYFIVGLGVPTQVILIPLFVMLAGVKLIDTHLGLIIAQIGLSMPFTIYLLSGFFRSLPTEIEEAAALDGSGPVRTFVRIVIPVAQGGIQTAFLLNLLGVWNETLMSLTVLQTSDKYTLPVALISFVQQQVYGGTNYGVLFAGVSIAVLPVLIVYSLLSRRFTESLTLGMGK